MKKRRLLALVMSAICIAAALPSAAVLADGQKVVTLGADLSEEQRQAILRYFGVAGQNIQTLTITNQDERNHLGSYVPLEQIGTHTYSCALVNPTNTGGIQVKTANLTWVTSNMIATTLSTSGVVNCEVLAAAPFEVSGTGALTGILMAYESAVGEPLDTQKKEVATQELITTTAIADSIGQAQATDIVNETKIQVVQQNEQNNNTINDTDIDVIINQVAEEEDIELSEGDRQLLADLMHQIAEQNYEYEDMKTTLERVEQNMDHLMEQESADSDSNAAQQPIEADAPVSVPVQTEAPADNAQTEQTETPETLPPDSILNQTDDSALGGSAVFDATDESAMPQTEMPAQSETPAQTEAAGDITIFSTDEHTSDPAAAQTEAAPDISVEPVNPDSQMPDPGQTEVPAQPETVPDMTVQTEAPAEQPDVQTDPNMQAETPAPGDEYGIDTMLPEPGEPILEVPEDITDEPMAPVLTMITADEMKFAPCSDSEMGETLPAGINELTITFQRSDIVAGADGSISIMNGLDGSEVETIMTADTSKVTIEALTPEELADLGWNDGCRASIFLSDPLAQMSYYYVNMSENAFSSADGSAMSEAIDDNLTWEIQTSEYGFCIDKDNLKAGSTISGQIMMDNTAAVAAFIENADPAMISFDQGEFAASGSFTATLNMAGRTSFQVSFYDGAGTLLDTIDYTITIK